MVMVKSCLICIQEPFEPQAQDPFTNETQERHKTLLFCLNPGFQNNWDFFAVMNKSKSF